MSKYGLNLRPQQKKQTTRPPLPTTLCFGDNDDNDVEKEISRQASKNKSLKDVSIYLSPLFRVVFAHLQNFLFSFSTDLMPFLLFLSCCED